MLWIWATLFLFDAVLVFAVLWTWLLLKREKGSGKPALLLAQERSPTSPPTPDLDALKSQIQNEILRLKRVCDAAEGVVHRAQARVLSFPPSEEECEMLELSNAIARADTPVPPPTTGLKSLLMDA